MQNELEVRRWVKAKFGVRVLWIEHASGGTLGMPDCLIIAGGIDVAD